MDKLTCSKCRLEKEANAFSKDKSSTRGYAYWCKDCMKINRDSPMSKKKAQKYNKRPEVIQRRKEYLARPDVMAKRRENKKRAYNNGGREKRKEYYLKNRDKLLARQKTPEARLSHKYNRLKYRYGITKQQYNDLYNTQKGKCPICELSIDILGRNTHLDHNHETGAIRGILCASCNLGIGYLYSKEILTKATKYISKSS